MGLTNYMKLIRACESKIPLLRTKCHSWVIAMPILYLVGPKFLSQLWDSWLQAFVIFFNAPGRSWYGTANYATSFQICYSPYHLVFHNGYWSPLLNDLSTMSWRCVGKWRYGSTILDLSHRCNRAVSLMPLPHYQLDRRIGGPHTVSLNTKSWEKFPCQELNSSPKQKHTKHKMNAWRELHTPLS
jgi:hypothetical protein